MSTLMDMDIPVPCDVAVVGGGPAGLSAAIALAERGAQTVLIARRAGYADNRTTALLGAIVLEDLDFVADCANQRLVPRDPNRITAEVE